MDSKTLQNYSSDRARFQGATELDGALEAVAEDGWRAFQEAGLPLARRGNELWKYTNLAPLAKMEFQHARPREVAAEQLRSQCPWDDGWTTAVMVDGVFSPQLSNLTTQPGLKVMGIAQAWREMPELLEEHLGHYARAEADAFTALNAAFLGGVVVVVEPGARLEKPVQLLSVTSGDDVGRAGYPRALVLLGEGSGCSLVETYFNGGSAPNLTAAVCEMRLGAEAELKHCRVQLEQDASYHIGNTRVLQEGGSSFKSISYATGPAKGRYDIHVQLSAPGAECDLQGLYMTTGDQHQSNEISTTHASPHCTSQQFFKGVLSGKSQAVFSGKIVVEEGAMKTEAQQKDLNLLLSRGAEIDTKPSLEIYADDVKCGHGATAGHLDPGALFYMQSRGIDKFHAMTLLAHGFAAEIVEQVEDDELRGFLEAKTGEAMRRLLSEADL